jgi:hypothetical protein
MGEKDVGTQTPLPHPRPQPLLPSSEDPLYESLVRSFSVTIARKRSGEVFVIHYVDSCI